MSQGQRRLAAIMFTDMVGFTSLSQQNEALAMKLLEEHRGMLRPIFRKHGGREIDTTGDAFLVEFGNALDAVQCAIDIQSFLTDSNRDRPNDTKIMLRIGVHLGDVIHMGKKVGGDAVNVASRIEPLAQPGGVCVTAQVYYSVVNKVECGFESLGNPHLKNVTTPVEVFRISGLGQAAAEHNAPQSFLPKTRIAVLPFANMSPDPNDAFFADGMTEEMISTISGVNELSVISRTSVMGYKGTTKKVGEIGNELKAGSILEGSIRKAGNRLRVTAQLIDANTDQHLWARSYDRELKDVFAIQSDIAQKVVEAMKVTLIPSEEGKIGRIRTRNMSAYESYLKGISVATQPLGRFADSVKFLEEAIRLDPEFSTAYSALGNFYLENAGEVIPLREGMEKAESLIEKALQIDDGSSDSHVAKGNLEMQYHLDYDVAERELTKGLDLSPGNPSAHLWYGVLLMVTRRLKEAVRELRIARELDPLSLPVAVNLVNALAITENYDDAIILMERSAKLEPHVAWYHLELALLYLRVGRVKEADDEVARAQPSEKTTWEEAMFAQDLALLGRGNQAREVLAKLEGNREAQFVSPTHLAKAYCALGEGEWALTLLEQDFEAGPVGFLFYSQLPDFDQIRDDPRFVSMGERLRLPNVP